MSKPKPPQDLWEQLNAVREKCSLSAPPPKSFTTMQYAQRFGVSRNIAYEDIQRLMALGKVKKADNCRKHYYVMV